MAQNFFTNQPSPIARMDTRLAGSIGDRIGAGLQQAAQGFVAGIERKRMKDEQKKKDEQALYFMQKLAPDLGLDPNDTETLKAGIDGMGGASQAIAAYSQIQQLKQQRQAEQENRLRLDELTRAIRENRIERGAQQGALAGIGGAGVTAQDILGSYARSGGSSVRTAADLAEIGRAIQPRQSGPQLVDFGGGIRGVVDPNGNTHMIPQPGTTGGSSAFERILAQEVASGRIKPEKAAEITANYLKRMSTPQEDDMASVARALGIDPNEMNPSTGSGQAPAPASPAKAQSAQTPTISSKAEYDALPPGTRFTGPDGKEYFKPEAKISSKGLSDLVTGG